MKSSLRWCAAALAVWLAVLALGPRPGDRAYAIPPAAADAGLLRYALVGTWYGEMPLEGGGRRQWRMVRDGQGGFAVDFRDSLPGRRPVERHESGSWGVSGPVYFTTTRAGRRGDVPYTLDAQRPGWDDAYEVLRWDGTEFGYRHLPSGREYSVRRVPDGFTFADAAVAP